jgi:hypothetical protein
MVSAITARHFEEIQLRPKDFTQYLLGPEVRGIFYILCQILRQTYL